MKIDPACPEQSNDREILNGLADPLSVHVLPLILLYAVAALVNGMVAIAQRRDPELRTLFNANLVASGFFYGYILTAFVISRFYGTPLFASGYLFALASFFYIYLLYVAVFFAQSILPNATAYEVEYGFIFDSLFALAASSFVSYGLSSSVNVVRSGVTFIVSAFGFMLVFDAMFIAPFLRFIVALRAATARAELEQTPIGYRARLPLFRDAWREARKLSRSQLNEIVRNDLRREQKAPPVLVAREVSRALQIFMATVMVVMPIAQYFVGRFLIQLVARALHLG